MSVWSGRKAAHSNDVIARQIAQRKAVAEVKGQAQRVFVTRKSFDAVKQFISESL